MSNQASERPHSQHMADTLLFLRKQLSDKDMEIMQVRPVDSQSSLRSCNPISGVFTSALWQVRHDHLKIVADARAAKKQWEDVLKQKNDVINDGATQIHRFASIRPLALSTSPLPVWRKPWKRKRSVSRL